MHQDSKTRQAPQKNLQTTLQNTNGLKEKLAGCNSTPHMKAEDVTQRYHDSWNRRDADALVGVFIEGGTYRSPDTPPEGVSGQDFAAFVKGVWTAFPDLFVEVIEAGEFGQV